MVPPVDVLESILSLPLPDLKEHLESATSEELRILRAYMGFGKAGTKEANKVLICEQVEKRRSQSGVSQLEDDSFAVPPAVSKKQKFDSMMKSDVHKTNAVS